MYGKDHGLVITQASGGVGTYRHGLPRGVYALVQLLFTVLGYVALTNAFPTVDTPAQLARRKDEGKATDDPSLYIYLGTAIALVLLGGAFAGLTIALMGQDEIYLQVIATSGEGSERRNAQRVLRLLKRGKHWVLVTLLVGNVITNETLPIVLDRSIGGGYAAAITSTVLVIIFGEIVPQSLCVRFGLPIGAWSSSFVLVLMWVFSPITWPIAKLLDRLLGKDHGTTYKKAGLKTLVTLHKNMGTTPGERLNQDEVSIISHVLDLKEKSVGSIMTPMEDVFTLSADAVLNEEMMNLIMREGYSRIPVHDPRNESDFVGMLLVKMLITYDPEDARLVCDFALATLPETRPETSCLDIINFFQEGKSHMVLVSDFPGETKGALGVVTLEDVIEELIGEEIIDESDVFVDVHKAIRRMQPAPTHRTRVPKGEIVTDPNNLQQQQQQALDGDLVDVGDPNEDMIRDSENRKLSSATDPYRRMSADRRVSAEYSRSPKATTFLMRRTNSASGSTDLKAVQLRQYTAEMKQQLNRLGPSNAAKQPRHTRVNTVKIKPGVTTIQEQNGIPSRTATPPPTSSATGQLGQMVSPGKSAKDGVQAVKAGFGAPAKGRGRSRSPAVGSASSPRDSSIPRSSVIAQQQGNGERIPAERTNSHSTVGSIQKSRTSSRSRWRTATSRTSSHGGRSNRGVTRSGSITEQFVESGGMKKLVLEMTSSSSGGEEEDEQAPRPRKDLLRVDDGSRPGSRGRGGYGSGDGDVSGHGGDEESGVASSAKKRKKKARGKKKKKDEEKRSGGDGAQDEGGDENTPLLSRDKDD